MKNLLLEKVDYQTEHTALGNWRRFLYPNGQRFAEFRSHAELLGLPLIHYTWGICPETGQRITAKGVIAVGRLAVGGLAIGHASAGLIAIGQAGLGLLFGLGQAATGYYALGQLALGWEFAIGQLAAAQTVVAQLGLGEWVLAQAGIGEYVWDQSGADPEAVAHFQGLWDRVLGWFRG